MVSEDEKEEEWEPFVDASVCGPLTCSISQSDLQCRERDEPAELKGVRITVRKC